jgi:hypothetical protein
MERTRLTPDKNELGLWRDANGEAYILNNFKGDESTHIHLGTEVWSALYNGVHCRIEWNKYTLPPSIVKPIQDILKVRLHQYAPNVILQAGYLLTGLQKIYDKKIITNKLFLSAEEMADAWAELNNHMRSDLRAFFLDLVLAKDTRVDPNIGFMMKNWKARDNMLGLRSVLEWDPTNGALTTSELEILRQALPESIDALSNKDALAVILLRIYLATLRRSQQITQISNEGLEIIQTLTSDPIQFFLVIPLIKAQAGSTPEWESIPEMIGQMIQTYQQRANVEDLQTKSKHLFVLPPDFGKTAEPGIHFALSSGTSRALLKNWVAKQNIISPRTGKPLNVTMRRLRHTGATQLARQGYSRQVIQDMLQHDSPHSASSYIDSVASDLTPLFERVDRQTGHTFTQIQGAFFKGRIVPTQDKPQAPILTPQPKGMAIVGTCSKSGVCGLHPLFSCYSGCAHFLAFKEAPHADTLTHVEKEYAHWRKAEPNGSRSKVIKDFERTIQGVRDVIKQIEDDV